MNSVLYHYCVQRLPSREEMGRAAARQVRDLICDLLRRKESIRMIFAAAPSQNEFLEALVKEPAIDFSRITAFHMDEYVGLPKEAPQGFGNFLRDRLFSKAAFRQVHYINGNAADIQAECERYCALLRETPIDIVCLGIGENGHIGFNEPASKLDNKTHLTALTESTIEANSRFFASADEVPRHALTMGVGTILKSKKIIIAISGNKKLNAFHKMLEGQIDTSSPATLLNLHNDVIVAFNE